MIMMSLAFFHLAPGATSVTDVRCTSQLYLDGPGHETLFMPVEHPPVSRESTVHILISLLPEKPK